EMPPTKDTFSGSKHGIAEHDAEINTSQVLASKASTKCNSNVGQMECSHSKAMHYKTTFAPLCESKHQSYSQQKVAYIQPYTQPSIIGSDKNLYYFTSEQEKSLFNHLIEVIKVNKSGYIDQHTLKVIISKKAKQEGWKNVHDKISNSLMNNFLDQHKELKCYIYNDIGLTSIQENVLYRHVSNTIGNLTSNDNALKQIDKQGLFNIAKEIIIKNSWENLYSITEKWVDIFLEKHSDLKKFIKIAEVDFVTTTPSSSNLNKCNENAISFQKSNIENSSSPEEIEEVTQSTKSWGIISDVFSLKSYSEKDQVVCSEYDSELLSLPSTSFKKVTTESLKASTTFRHPLSNLDIEKEKQAYKVIENKLSSSHHRNLPKCSKTSLSTTERIADAVTASTLNIQIQNASNVTGTEASNRLLSSKESMNRSNIFSSSISK
ncbi:unnamed protein product, partial [Meganyctiphanes norvegica]